MTCIAERKDLGIALVTLSRIDSRQQGFALIAPMMGAFADMARTKIRNPYGKPRGRASGAPWQR